VAALDGDQFPVDEAVAQEGSAHRLREGFEAGPSGFGPKPDFIQEFALG
jgi:hypothetical protein